MFKGNSQWALLVSQFVDQWYDHYYTCKRHFCVGDCSSAPNAFCYLWKQFAIFDQKMGPVRVGQSKLSVFWASCLPQQLISSRTKLCWGQVAVIQWLCKGNVDIWIELGMFAIKEFPYLTEFVMCTNIYWSFCEGLIKCSRKSQCQVRLQDLWIDKGILTRSAWSDVCSLVSIIEKIFANKNICGADLFADPNICRSKLFAD